MLKSGRFTTSGGVSAFTHSHKANAWAATTNTPAPSTKARLGAKSIDVAVRELLYTVVAYVARTA
jgi:hypothetical protein